MKLNSNPSMFKVSTTAIALLLMAGISNVALADSATAAKTDGKVAEVKSSDSTAIDTGTKAPADENFKSLDANKDGKISLKEAVKDKSLSGQFDVLDANRDGLISAEEYASVKAASPATSTEATPPVSKY